MKTKPSLAKQVPQSITGRDGYIICKALAYGIEAIERLPERWREQSDRADMVALLEDATNSADRYRLVARAHLERRGLNLVAGQIELGDKRNKQEAA